MASEALRSHQDETLAEALDYEFEDSSACQRLASTLRVSESSEHLIAPSPSPHPRFARKAFISQWVPEVEPRHPRARTFRTWHSRRDVVLWICTGVSVTVFLVNLISTIVFAVKYPPIGGIGVIFQGKQSHVARLSSILHVFINFLSTLLLGASNMCMQLCVAPTRQELDHAHRRNVWLDIGTPSIRNLKWISRGRQLLFAFLCLSSIPLHFLWNSAIFPSLVVNTYIWGLVNPKFLHGGEWNITLATQEQDESYQPVGAIGGTGNYDAIQRLQYLAVNDKNLTRLGPLECIERYTSPFGPRSDVLLVTADYKVENNNSLYATGLESGIDFENMGNWLCYWGFHASPDIPIQADHSCRKLGTSFFPGVTQAQRERAKQKVIQGWEVEFRNVSYCLGTEAPTENLYTVEYSLTIMIIVCVANFCKVVGIVLTAIRYRKYQDPPLSVLGDAIASFLGNPDLSTRGLGACFKKDIAKREASAKLKNRRIDSEDDQPVWIWKPASPQVWVRKNFSWFDGAGRSKWLLAIGMCLLTILLASFMLILGLIAAAHWISIGTAYAEGFGSANSNSIVEFTTIGTGTGRLYKQIVFANFWQFAISFLYVLVNSLITSLLVGSEWSHYAKHRKPLRVSAPSGIQRSSFFISMPYKIGAPLMTAIAVLHWTVSQSVFLIRIAAYYSDGTPDTGSSVSAVGYSCSAITVSVVLGITIVSCVVLLGFKKYTSGMPMASTCSAAISAACHCPTEDFDAEYLPVMWGIVDEDEQGHQYCSFTTAKDCRPIGAPIGWKEWEMKQEHQESAIGSGDKRTKKKRKLASAATAFKDNVWRPINRAFHAGFWKSGKHGESVAESEPSLSSSLEASLAEGDETTGVIGGENYSDGPAVLIAPWPETEASRRYEEERAAYINALCVPESSWLASWKAKMHQLGRWPGWHAVKLDCSFRKDTKERASLRES